LRAGSFAPAAVTTTIDWSNLPLIFGIMAFSYAGHSVFPSIQASMRSPSQFPAVLDTAYIIVALLCTFLGTAGYYMYGNGALDVITFNMQSGVCVCPVFYGCSLLTCCPAKLPLWGY
jgi:solute carrier family 32 (vesicular inhibitory amino acid transporter)